MLPYLLRRLALLPITLFSILLVNFAIINMAPGDPVTISDISPEGVKRQDRSFAFGSDERWLQFREHYGLTLPIFFNSWPWISLNEVEEKIEQLTERRYKPSDSKEMSVKDYDALRLQFGDQSPYIMPKLLDIVTNAALPLEEREMAMRFFVRGGTKQTRVSASLTPEERGVNRLIAESNSFLQSLLQKPSSEIDQTAAMAKEWYERIEKERRYQPDFFQKLKILFFETRISRYFSRVVTFDFGTMRNDNNKRVIDEVAKRFKYSLTLSLIPMLSTFFLCLVFGMAMAFWHNSKFDHGFNIFLLILYALPIFVVAPWLIEKLALHYDFPFTHVPIPLSGFTSPDSVYNQMNSWERLKDVLAHIALPLVAIMYGGFAAQTRIARTAVLEVSRQDYVRTAKAKGVGTFNILTKHIGRNAAITIVTSLASSLGIVLGGSLIVETLFEIDGFGKFFYDAIINRDYNVILFSALAGSALSLLGYLLADLAYTWLDPRLSLEDS
jgi:peptide/nickel transport system permease protein